VIPERLFIRAICDGDSVDWLRLDREDRPLGKFFRDECRENHRAMAATTFVLSEHKRKIPSRLWGYITLICSEVRIANGQVGQYPEAALKHAIPSVKIARLAVDNRIRGRGWGESLVNLALASTVEQVALVAGCRLVIVDAKRQSVEFYKRCNFVMLDTPENRNQDHPLMFFDLLRA
jgi:predicted GNAT family N-acyltransferase